MKSGTIPRLPDAELAVMQAIWQLDCPCTRPELDGLLQPAHGWGPTTVLNLLSRLENRGFVEKQRQGRGYLYVALVNRDAYLQSESRNVLTRVFGGSVKQFVAALNGGESLSTRDVEELSDYLETLKHQPGQ